MQFEQLSLLFHSVPGASRVKHQDVPRELVIYFANSALPAVHKPLVICEAPRFLDSNSSSFKNLLYYVEVLTLSTRRDFWPREPTSYK